MSLLQCTNKKGMGLIEVVVAMFLTTVGVMAILSLQPTALRTSAQSDLMGRASGILYKTIEDNESIIMNCCNAVAVGTTNSTVTVSNQAGVATGDATFNVQRVIAFVGASPDTWRITVTVTWPTMTSATGLSDSLLVTRQEYCTFPAAGTAGCPIGPGGC